MTDREPGVKESQKYHTIVADPPWHYDRTGVSFVDSNSGEFKGTSMSLPEGLRKDAIRVELSRPEWAYAAWKGIERQIDGVLRKSTHRYGQTSDPYQQNIQGACGELAVSKLIGHDWDGAYGDFGAMDAGRYQVRTTMRHDGKLAIYSGDKQHHVFVLVVGVAPVLYIAGVARASRVCVPEYSYGEHWRVPQVALYPAEHFLRAAKRSAAHD